jgi:AraC-like DNA-binding protein
MLYIDIPWLCETQDGNRGLAPLAEVSSTQPELYAGLDRTFDTLMDRSAGLLEKQTASIGLVELLQRCLGTNRSTHPARVPRLTRAADFIRDNCARALSLEEICREVSLSASHLIRAFKETYGLTPHAYQLNCRIEFCRARLRAGHPIAEVALAAGFSDQAHFQRTFKRFVAATPGQYQSRYS